MLSTQHAALSTSLLLLLFEGDCRIRVELHDHFPDRLRERLERRDHDNTRGLAVASDRHRAYDFQLTELARDRLALVIDPFERLRLARIDRLGQLLRFL